MLTKKPLISVIVPVYNVSGYVHECLQSILSQNYCNFEIIVVDDASTDDSVDIVRKTCCQQHNVKLICHDRNKGLAAARNTGLCEAQGDYIAFVDSDDYIASDYLEQLYSNAVEHDADISICGRFLTFHFPDGVKHVKDCRSLFSNKKLINLDALKALNSFNSFDVSMCSRIIKKSLFNDVVFPEGKLSEDFFVSYQIMYKAKSVYYDPKPLYFYRQRYGSISRGAKINYDLIEASDNQLYFFLKNCPSLRYLGETTSAFTRIAIVNEYIQRDMPLSSLRENKLYVRKHIISILLNRYISAVKKIQACVVATSLFVYKIFFIKFSERGRLQKKQNDI